jgi:hypothetical protein
MEPENDQVLTPAMQQPLGRSTRRRRSNKPLITIVILAIVAAAAFFGYKQFKGSSNSESVSPTPQPTMAIVETPTPESTSEANLTPTATAAPSPTAKASPTEKPAVKAAADMNIQVLNGTGEVGIAGTARDFLKGKGYKYLETGNADNNDYVNVTVKSKPSMDKYVTTLKSDLSEKYTLASSSGTLSEDSLFDATVTLGK